MATMVDSPTNPARREPTPRVAPCTLGMRTQRPFVIKAELRHTPSQNPAKTQEGCRQKRDQTIAFKICT